MFFKKSKPLNYEDRADGASPCMLLLHYTGMESMEAAKERLSDPESKVSAHYLIDEDGHVFDLVPDSKRAWHAGLSYWGQESDINSVSIGIEIVNPGHEFGYRDFSPEQMESVLGLCKKLMSKYNIVHVLGHSDVAPERKMDPGEKFDWKWLAENGVGMWPDPTSEEYEKAELIARHDYDAEKLFAFFGYNPMSAYIDVVTAYHRHFYPEIFESGNEGTICQESVARLLSLIRQKRARENS